VQLLGRIAICGPQGDGGTVLPGRRSELVFAYLVAEHHRVVTQDELADALWPGSLPDTWAAGLRGVVTEVRRFLEQAGLDPAEILTTARGGYQLRLPAGVVVDLDEARGALGLARAALDAGDGAQAASQANRSSTLAQLGFIPNHDGEWVAARRRELEDIQVRALEVEARGHQAAGDMAAAAAAAERLVRAAPFSEAGHQLRIRVLGQAGDRAAAIKAFEHCRTILADELDVEPSDETKAALAAAVLGEPAAQSTPPAAAETPGPAPLGELSVLVVEDHDFQRRTTRRLLQGLGVGAVEEAADGAAGLELLSHSRQPDVIVCDIDMPGMDGVEFIRRVAERGLASAVLIASGLDSKVLDAVKTIVEANKLQLLGAVEKPLTARRLGELLATYRRQPSRPSSGVGVSITAHEVAAAVAEGRMITLFEPIVDLAQCRVRGAEAVSQWVHPTKGVIPPASFLSFLDASSIVQYDAALLADVCGVLRQSGEAGLRIEIGLDLAPPALSDVALADRFIDAVRAGDAEPSQLTCEVPEHGLPQASSLALDVMTRLRVKGFGLALDHFGTGRPSPRRLAPLPITSVKIDESLVSGAVADRERLELLEEMLDAARSLETPVVATGCDSEEDFDLVAEMGFRYAQGSFIAPAMPAAELVDWAVAWTPSAPGGTARR
jgi:EAL domain-containing protein (putative c-di-GMP-specific phosphodiesterase class I)/DNA-binding SARP family transcriptional activator/ActR/RegA family two-component response regulator